MISIIAINFSYHIFRSHRLFKSAIYKLFSLFMVKGNEVWGYEVSITSTSSLVSHGIRSGSMIFVVAPRPIWPTWASTAFPGLFGPISGILRHFLKIRISQGYDSEHLFRWPFELCGSPL